MWTKTQGEKDVSSSQRPKTDKRLGKSTVHTHTHTQGLTHTHTHTDTRHTEQDTENQKHTDIQTDERVCQLSSWVR